MIEYYMVSYYRRLGFSNQSRTGYRFFIIDNNEHDLLSTLLFVCLIIKLQEFAASSIDTKQKL